MIQDYLKISGRNLTKRKLRLFLTLLSILIAITTIFVLISVSLGLQGAVKEQFRQFGTDKFFVQPLGQLAGPGTGGAVELTIKDADVIEKVPGVKDISYATASSAQIEFGDEARYTTILGIPLDKSAVFIETGFYKADEGALLKKGDSKEIMIGSQYKNNNFFKKPIHVGDKITVNGETFRVKSVLKTVGNPFDDRLIFMPLEDFRNIFPQTNERIDQLAVQINQDENVKDVALRVEKKLLKSRGLTEKTKDFEILTPEEVLESFGTVLNILTAFLLAVAAISLLVGGIGIANTMFTSVLERTKEIGVMKSIGAKNSNILVIFLLESGFLGLIGGILGVLLGISITKIIEYIAVNQLGTTLLQAATPAYLIFGCLAFSFLIGTISGFWPAYKALKVKPVEALRYE